MALRGPGDKCTDLGVLRGALRAEAKPNMPTSTILSAYHQAIHFFQCYPLVSVPRAILGCNGAPDLSRQLHLGSLLRSRTANWYASFSSPWSARNSLPTDWIFM